MSGVSYPPANLAALTAAIPVMATAAPAAVTDSSTAGAVTNEFAGKFHAHASKARKSRVTGVTTATYAWTYPAAFGVSVVPVLQAIVEDPANTATDSYNIQVVGVPTNIGCTFRIIRMSSGLLVTLLGALSLNPTPGTVNLHLTAFEP